MTPPVEGPNDDDVPVAAAGLVAGRCGHVNYCPEVSGTYQAYAVTAQANGLQGGTRHSSPR